MKFNQQELACFASSRQGKADKEGVLWLREIDGTKVKKKQGVYILLRGVFTVMVRLNQTPTVAGYVQRWFTLSGNMLFYSKSDLPVSLSYSRIHL